QAEDGIRDRNVTGVQTCALPISNALGIDARNKLRQTHIQHVAIWRRRNEELSLSVARAKNGSSGTTHPSLRRTSGRQRAPTPRKIGRASRRKKRAVSRGGRDSKE